MHSQADGSALLSEYFEQLGHVVNSMNLIELHLITAIAHFMDHDLNLTLTLFSGKSYGELSSILLRLFQYRVDDLTLQAEFRARLKECDDCSQERNKFVHSFWSAQPKTGLVDRLKFPRGKTFKIPDNIIMDTVDVKDLKTLQARIEAAASEFSEFVFKMTK